ASATLAHSDVPRMRHSPRACAPTADRAILAAGSGAPARMTPTVSHTAIAAPWRVLAGGAAVATNSDIHAVTLLVATAMLRSPITRSTQSPLRLHRTIFSMLRCGLWVIVARHQK